jgi:hypothetical protein
MRPQAPAGSPRPNGDGGALARGQDPKQRLAEDARRTAGYMDAVAADARRQGAELPEATLACITVWRHWAARLAVWAHGDTDKHAGGTG